MSNLQVYLDYFKGREDHFAAQGPDDYYPIKRSFDEGFLKQHLGGLATYGIYVLTSESKCNFTCFDLDISQKELEKIDFKNPAHKFNHLKGNLINLITVFKTTFEIPAKSILLEETGGRGYHVWLFFTQGWP